MAQQWALVGNIVIACAYAAITVAIVVPVRRAGQLRTNRLAVATAMIFFSCAVGHGFHALMYWQAAYNAMPDMLHATGLTFWSSALWDVFTAAVGVYYWTLRRGYGVLLGGTGALYVDPTEQQRRHDIELRERVAEGRAEAEAERDAQAAMLRAVISNSQSAVYIKDLDGHYLLANEAFQTAFGVTEDEIIGKTDDYIDPRLAPQWQANDRRAHAGPVRLEETAETAVGTRAYESTKFPLFDHAGDLYAICGVSLDVTDLRAAAVAAEAARDEALAQSQVKSDFLATMSHEIRTPMNGVLGLASLLLATGLDEPQRRYATGIHNAGTALLGVINDILDFSKIEAGKVLLDPADFDLPAVLTETAALVAPGADAKNLAVVIRRGPHLPATVHGDGGRVRQILLNLAGNAVKFTADGSVTLRADLIAEPLTVRFEVVDTGIGISPADAHRLFEPFTQADASTTRKYGGTGLGLAISRQLTEAMGGRIGVEPAPGGGSTFWCEIPFAPATGDTPAEAPAPDGAGLRILLCGTGTDRDGLHDDLRRWRMTVTAVDTAADAITRLRAAAGRGRPYDLLLLDAAPGDVDTDGLARLVTTDPDIPAVHTIVLNGDAPAGGAAGERTYLPTPVHRSQLYDLLAQSMAAVIPVPVTGPAPATAPATGKGTVLLVEDNDINQMVAVGILTGLGYRTDVAGDGQVALDLAAENQYDAILMDCRMPRMDGFTATAHLRVREAAGTRHTPIIAMTASALVADRERCLTAGMDDYLAKPVNPSELAATLEHWITGTPRTGPAPHPDAQASAAARTVPGRGRPYGEAAGRGPGKAGPQASGSAPAGRGTEQVGPQAPGAGPAGLQTFSPEDAGLHQPVQAVLRTPGPAPDGPQAGGPDHAEPQKAGGVAALGAEAASTASPARGAGGTSPGTDTPAARAGAAQTSRRTAGMPLAHEDVPGLDAGLAAAVFGVEVDPMAALAWLDSGSDFADWVDAVVDPRDISTRSLPRATMASGWVQQPPGMLVPARLSPPPAIVPAAADPAAAGPAGDDPIGQRLDELAGDHTAPEQALVQRLVTSFLARAPQHLTAILDAVAAADLQTVEDQAHSLKGAAGNIGATRVLQVCSRIEDDAREGTLPGPADTTELRTELDRAQNRLREVATV